MEAPLFDPHIFLVSELPVHLNDAHQTRDNQMIPNTRLLAFGFWSLVWFGLAWLVITHKMAANRMDEFWCLLSLSREADRKREREKVKEREREKESHRDKWTFQDALCRKKSPTPTLVSLSSRS